MVDIQSYQKARYVRPTNQENVDQRIMLYREQSL